jgi:hypothetical protein
MLRRNAFNVCQNTQQIDRDTASTEKLRESVTALDTTYLSGGNRTMSH